MGGLSAAISSPSQAASPLVDPSFNSVKLLLTSSYPAGQLAYNSDASSNALIVSPQTTTVRSDPFSPFQDGYYGIQFNGSSQSLSVASTAGIDISTGDFTIEFWSKPTTAQVNSVDSVFGYQAFGTMLYRNGTSWVCEVGDGNANYFSLSATVTAGEWQHLALVRSGSTFTLYKDGVSASTNTTAGALGTVSRDLLIGLNITGGNQRFSGTISNFRIVKGKALYSGTFTPPTSPLLVTSNTTFLSCYGSRIADFSPTAATITSFGSPLTSLAGIYSMPTTIGSLSLNGTSDYLSIPSSAPIVFGTGDFTIEAWIYRQDAGAANTSYTVVSNISSNNNNSWCLYIYNGLLRLDSWSTGYVTGTTTIAQNTWYHVSVTRVGTTFTMYINGVQDATGTSTTDLNTTAPLYIGFNSIANSYWNGYISNLRLTKGVALYTANFTPSTVPLRNEPNTSLLTLQTAQSPVNSLFTDRSPRNFPFPISGNPYQGGVSPYITSTWGVFFNGSNDYLSVANNAALNLSSGNFTIEAWVNLTKLGSKIIVNKDGISGSNYASYSLGTDSSTRPTFYMGRSDGATVVQVITGTVPLALNTWYHIAATRSGSTIQLYVDGVSVASTTLTITPLDSARALFIGHENNAVTDYSGGTLSNLRIVKGTAVYTSNFTPPTFTLPAIAGTSLLVLSSSTFVDTSPNNFSLSLFGGTVAITSKSPFAQPPAGSIYFDGSSAVGANVGSAAGSATLGAGDFTAECWLRMPSLGTISVCIGNEFTAGGGDTQWQFYISASGQVLFTGWNTTFLTSSTTIVANTWTHIAVARVGTALTMYLNGASVATATNTQNFSSTNPLTIGRAGDNTKPLTGYVADVRIISGVSMYTGAFTPPNAPLSSTSKTVSLIGASPVAATDVSRNTNFRMFGNTQLTNSVRKYGSASLSFPGTTGSYVKFLTSAGMALGSGDFTLEFWFNPTTNANYLLDFSVDSTNGTAPQIYYNGGWSWLVNAGDRIVGTTAVTGQWNHLAVVRSGGVTKMYINGTQSGASYTDTTVYTVNTNAYIGCAAANQGGPFSGYFDSLRITPGVARYTANFTVPATVFPSQ